jgi:hypothetical protein
MRQEGRPTQLKSDETWQAVGTAPFNRDIELAVIDYDGIHALVFPCQRILGGWIHADTKNRVDVRPTHWRGWRQNV